MSIFNTVFHDSTDSGHILVIIRLKSIILASHFPVFFIGLTYMFPLLTRLIEITYPSII